MPDLIETVDFKEEIFHTFENVEFSFSAESPPHGTGKLFITTGRAIWICGDPAQPGFKSFDFDIPFITLHAVTRDPTTYPRPCLYCQLNVDDDEEDTESFGECFFSPIEEEEVMNLFDAFCSAAQRNPAEDDDIGGLLGDDDDELIFDVDEVVLGAEQARQLSHLESVFQAPTDGNQDIEMSD